MAKESSLAIVGQEWPLQDDHIRIQEQDIATWIDDRFEISRRQWVGQYLTFEFVLAAPR